MALSADTVPPFKNITVLVGGPARSIAGDDRLGAGSYHEPPPPPPGEEGREGEE